MNHALIIRGAAVALFGAVIARPTAAQQPTAPASIVGIAYDSVRSQPMARAEIAIQGTTLFAVAGDDGHFHFDSVAPGQHRLIVGHPILDSLGIQLMTPPLTFSAGKQATLDLATPSAATLVKMLCPAAWLTRGPAALFGRVHNADTGLPVPNASVSVVWYEIDYLKLSKIPRLREATTGKDGTYRICGLPASFDGKVQVNYAGLKSGDVPVSFNKSVLEMRSLSVASAAPVTVATGDTNPQPRHALAVASLRGRVLGTTGLPVAGARVQLEGTFHSVNSGADGSFQLDSLPSGSQVVRAMFIGFTPVEQSVELSSNTPVTVTLQMQKEVAMLPTVTTQARRLSGLDAVGFTQREKTGMGFYLDEKTIDRKQASKFTDLLTAVPGIHVSQSGYDTYVTDNRNPMGGCVQYVVDGSPWTSVSPGDINSFIQGYDVGAIEVYHGADTPPQFQFAGQSGCVVIVAWTKWRLDRNTGGGR
ncbi:MAG: carboxypeptidase regulatory-like domain-containing protein [Gemmatimonadaceae bacterium]|nr:carboxypeptidase regulatory-like domain-containing protein [Gemmatimonadaceae bacterium]